jgi:hypothetical protein
MIRERRKNLNKATVVILLRRFRNHVGHKLRRPTVGRSIREKTQHALSVIQNIFGIIGRDKCCGSRALSEISVRPPCGYPAKNKSDPVLYS